MDESQLRVSAYIVLGMLTSLSLEESKKTHFLTSQGSYLLFGSPLCLSLVPGT